MKAREGDYIEDFRHTVFDVKGLIHPPHKIIAFPRFIPDSAGARRRDGVTYTKIYSLADRFAWLEEISPDYIVCDPVFDVDLCEVPLIAVRRHYKPTNILRILRKEDEVDELKRVAMRFMTLVKENSGVAWDTLGLSGSVMVGLHTSDSDIDPVAYGSQSCHKIYSALRSMHKDRTAPIKPYTLKELEKLYAFRSKDTATPFEDFVKTESRKVLQGTFMGRDYFLRFVKGWDEIAEEYGVIRYKQMGYVKIKARVSSDVDAIFTPCCYKIDDVEVLEGSRVKPITEIVSYRGRFCENARLEEKVVAQGKIEKVITDANRKHFRLLLGNEVSDYLVLA